MRIACFLIAFCLLGMVNPIKAELNSGLWLTDGKNEVAVTIVNSWTQDLSKLKLEVAKELLPSWLQVSEAVQTVDVPKGSRVEKQLILTFIVTEAPPEASSEIPLFLKDDKGNQWSFTTNINVKTGPSTLPKAFSLSQNNPNPFNPSTNISYAVPEGGQVKVSIKVYDARGRVLRTLVDTAKEPGTYNVFWDGSDENGRPIASGVYFYRMKAGSFDQTRKMVVLK